jgi:hypothetical protein
MALPRPLRCLPRDGRRFRGGPQVAGACGGGVSSRSAGGPGGAGRRPRDGEAAAGLAGVPSYGRRRAGEASGWTIDTDPGLAAGACGSLQAGGTGTWRSGPCAGAAVGRLGGIAPAAAEGAGCGAAAVRGFRVWRRQGCGSAGCVGLSNAPDTTDNDQCTPLPPGGGTVWLPACQDISGDCAVGEACAAVGAEAWLDLELRVSQLQWACWRARCGPWAGAVLRVAANGVSGCWGLMARADEAGCGMCPQADAEPRKRTFRKFTFRGVDLEQLLDLPTDKLVDLFHARARRRFQRGLKRKPLALIKKLRKAVRASPHQPPVAIRMQGWSEARRQRPYPHASPRPSNRLVSPSGVPHPGQESLRQHGHVPGSLTAAGTHGALSWGCSPSAEEGGSRG